MLLIKLIILKAKNIGTKKRSFVFLKKVTGQKQQRLKGYVRFKIMYQVPLLKNIKYDI